MAKRTDNIEWRCRDSTTAYGIRKNNDQPIMRAVGETCYPEPLEAGVEVHLFEPTMMRTKAVIVDERWGSVGSPNFDNRSFELDDEIVPICDSVAPNAALRDNFEADLARDRLDEYERGVVDRRRGGLRHVLLALREQL